MGGCLGRASESRRQRYGVVKMGVRYDDSLPLLAETIVSELGETALGEGTVLRDAIGQLAFFSAQPMDEAKSQRLTIRLRDALGAYARQDRVVAGTEDIGALTVLQDPAVQNLRVGSWSVRLLDRRLVGADWLRFPAPFAAPPPRIVFGSLKGGVGRSTALSVVAAHLAGRGQRVLAIDLDMEAPGLGPLLLNDETLPPFGIIDALVENGLSGLDDGFLADLVGPSSLAARQGRIDVIPALGKRSICHPADVLAKLARAYTEDVRPDGTVATILDQVRALVDHFADPKRYDVILLDARAGLHETTASAVLGLGAEVLFFALNEPQTFQGYGVLLAHLARFLPSDGTPPEWLERLTIVQGKAPVEPQERAAFSQTCRELFARVGLGPRPPGTSPTPVSLPAEPFKDVPWDDSPSDDEVLPEEGWMREPLAILDDPRFARFDPLQRRDLLAEELYMGTFRSLLDRVDVVLKSPGADE
jgi:hypothetical protein